MSDVRFFQDARAIESLRESDFDTVSAYGEVLDNSMEAGATEIKVRFATESVRKGYEAIASVAFGDDGYGMDALTLHNCLTIGWSSRYNSRSGIGRFGVGMTLGAIHECKRVEIWTKQAGGTWNYLYMDLDEIAGGALTRVPAPEPRPLPSQFVDLVGVDHGTLVVWRDYDRQQRSAVRVVEDFRTWAGRTYRYFLWGDVPGRSEAVTLWIDDQKVKVIDPLYTRTRLTQFPDDKKALPYSPMEVEWAVDTNVEESAGRMSQVRILMSELPEDFWRRAGDGGRKPATDRFIDDNEGISILRNHREVFYGSLPHWKDTKSQGWPSFEALDRWWGCEVHFDAVLDRAFQVKNIKRGAVPCRPLKLSIKDKIRPTRDDLLERIRDVRAKTKRADALEKRKKQKKKEVPREGDHSVAESIARKAPVPRNEIDVGKDVEKEARDKAKTYADRYDEEQQQRLAELFKSQPFTIMEESWRGPQFFESSFLGGNAVLGYNKDHVFFQYLDGLLSELETESADPIALAREIRTMIDLLIMGYAKAEAGFSADGKMTAKEFLDFLQSAWGQFLSSYVTRRREARAEEGEDDG